MAKIPQENFDLNNVFYLHLRMFYEQNRGLIRKNYRKLTKVFLDYNDPERPGSYLRIPQFEALEMYVFLKEFLDNKPVYQLFEDWYQANGKFEKRDKRATPDSQIDLFWDFSEKQYKDIFKKMKAANDGRIYSNYIFALTMGTGKTILMATCIFYDFLLANKFPKDKRYIHNALVFAPDKTVLQSLRELESFDHSKVIPKEYLNVLLIKFHYLEDAGVSLSTQDGSKFNIVVSNSQKIILKRKNKESTSADKLFSAGKDFYKKDGIGAEQAALLGLDSDEIGANPEEEAELVTNQRFEKLRRLEQLGIFVDEAHHAFGVKLAKDMGIKKDPSQNSLRKTIDELALSLKKRNTQLVACYNYTGTPYVGKDVLPEVVYAYGLKEAIDKNYLKLVELNGYSNTKSEEFLEIAITDFIEKIKGKRPEEMLPKMAIFGATIQELQEEIKPAVEEILSKHGISSNKILVNVGDPKLTTDDDVREFNHLDSPKSEKQFILLVNKGREGWNCRSLFSVALYRAPKSKVFVLQATMRCLRSIGSNQETGLVYLTKENMELLDKELQANFRISTDEMQNVSSNKEKFSIRPVKPIEKIKIKRIRRKFNLKEKKLKEGAELKLKNIELDKYMLMHTQQKGLTQADSTVPKHTEELTDRKNIIVFSRFSLTAEVSRYLNKPCLLIEEIIDSTVEGYDEIIKLINRYNEVLYDYVIPRLFSLLYEIESEQVEEEHEIALVNEPPLDKGCYTMNATRELTIQKSDPKISEYIDNTFHLDTYCFDSIPERDFFWHVLQSKKVDKIWFTGMLTHGQSDFFIQYVDPDTHRVRSYYPDFLIKKSDDSYVMIEIKGEHMVDSENVQAKKEYAQMIAEASNMSYELIRGKQAQEGTFDRDFLEV